MNKLKRELLHTETVCAADGIRAIFTTLIADLANRDSSAVPTLEPVTVEALCLGGEVLGAVIQRNIEEMEGGQ